MHLWTLRPHQPTWDLTIVFEGSAELSPYLSLSFLIPFPFISCLTSHQRISLPSIYILIQRSRFHSHAQHFFILFSLSFAMVSPDAIRTVLGIFGGFLWKHLFLYFPLHFSIHQLISCFFFSRKCHLPVLVPLPSVSSSRPTDFFLLISVI